jgi:hypothetical protein
MAVSANQQSPPELALGMSTPRALTIEEVVAKFAAIPPVDTKVGPLTFSVQTDASRGQAVVTVVLAGATVLTQLLSLSNSRLALDVAVGDCSAKGGFTLTVLDPPYYSSVNADLRVIQHDFSSAFKGMADIWIASAQPVIGEYITFLTAELTTLTTVRGAAANLAQFQFFSADTAIAQAEATQFAPVQSFPGAIVAEEVRIEPEAMITLSIPTTITPGWLFLQAVFSSATTPSTRISASVANWTLPSVG